LPRDLADVFHYFLPEVDDAPETSGTSIGPVEVRTPTPVAAPPPLPILAMPIGERDVVRAALAWNLTIETARLGASAIMIAPATDAGSPLWPEPGMGPLGTELVFCPATDLEGLYKAATDLARSHAERARHGGIVFVRVPPAWLEVDATVVSPVRWALLLTSANRRDLHEAYGLAKGMMAANPKTEVGVTIHGVNTVSEARGAFEYLSRISEERLGLGLISYGLLVDDLHVYRAIAAQRPIGLAHPQAPATRALMDVAQLLHEDARSRALG